MTHRTGRLMFLTLLTLTASFWIGAPALAAEAEPAKAPEGIAILILLIGLSAIGFIALTLIGRMMPARATSSQNIMEDDELIDD